MDINLGTELEAGSNLVIEALGNADVVESHHNYKVPVIYDASAILTGTNATSVVYVHSGTLTVSSSQSVGKIVVCPGATLKIESSGALTVNDCIIMRTKSKKNVAYKAPELINNGTLTLSGEAKFYYSRVVADNTELYPIGFPFDVTVANTKLSNGDAVRGTHYAIQFYDGESRAANGVGSNWKLYTGATMTAKTGYLLLSTSNYYREFLFPVTYSKSVAATVSVTAHPSSNEADQGWNVIVSPFTATSEVTTVVPSQTLKVSKLFEDNTNYYQDAATDLEPTVPFYLQAAEDATISFKTSAAAARRRAHSGLYANSNIDYSDNSIQEQWIRLSYIESKGESQQQKADITNIFLHPTRFTEEYETGLDVVKMSTAGERPFIYTSIECGDLAFAALPDATAEVGIPVTVSSPEDGDYTFAVEHNDFLTRLDRLYLVDALYEDMIDLLENDYTIDVPAGTTAGRFSLRAIYRAPQITTDIEDLQQGGNDTVEKPRKIYRDGYIYILMPDGTIYTATGKRVEK